MIQKEGTVRFLKHHEKAVKGVSFNPCERYIFCSGGNDGKINIYGLYGLIVTYPLMNREINNVKFTVDGRKILAALSSKKFVMLDVETGQPVRYYENCCFSSSNRDYVRVPIATDVLCPFVSITTFINGRGISIFDSRMPLPVEFVCDLTTSEIRDIKFLNSSWPFIPTEQHTGLATLTSDGNCKITTIDGKLLHCFEVGHKSSSLTMTPEQFKPVHSSSSSNFRSSILVGGDFLSSYSPESSSYDKVLSRLNYSPGINHLSNHSTNNQVIQDYFSQIHNLSVNLSNSSSSALNTFILPSSISTHTFSNHHHLTTSNNYSSNQINNRRINNLINTIQIPNSILQLKYGTNGGLLYATTSNTVIKFRRYPNEHRLIGDLYSHKSEIYDFDISPYDEFLVTASKDKTIGIYCLGKPNRGTTSISQLT